MDYRRRVRKAPRFRANAADEKAVEERVVEGNPEDEKAAENLQAVSVAS